MMKTLILKSLAKIYRTVSRPEHPRWGWPENEDEDRLNANDDIFNLLQNEKPCLVGRMGTSEGMIIWNYLSVHSNRPLFRKSLDFIKGEARMPWWDQGRPFYDIQNSAGFFSDNFGVSEMEKFSELYLKYIPEIDICGRFEYYERFIPFSETCKYHQLETIYPFLVERSWMRALKDKNILVIHPFKKTIETQYFERRKFLFCNEEWLPEFKSLTVIKAVQTSASEKCEYKDWFEALESMKKQIDKTDFDIALIGCGAYGLPLAGYCKEIGKKAIHLGGGLQLLFGIKGRRWEQQYKNSCYRDMFNEYWTYPSEEEKPKGAEKVEGACYW